ncbi:ATP-binding protein, partial [Candidatus Bathyarchaeota archaeon A05DMB-2]|nr:ATP-binding protein [Candidatus Bathyarchaeota archaeon A05DMB-2]
MLSDARLFDLNIEKVLEDWEVYHAIREIIANALDEQVLTKTKEIEISRDAKGSWHIRDFGRGLKYEHLTQNENEEKLSHSNLVIGKFGVGLKDALAT